ncbi:hypothetical protein SB753_37640, partial [Paraburkholderia sp. SIMBA_053]
LVAHGGAFAGARLDIGTRVLLEVLCLGGSQLLKNGLIRVENGANGSENGGSSGAVNGDRPSRVLDLGCGTGALAVSYALAHPGPQVIAT